MPYIDKTTGLPPDIEADRRLCLCLEPDSWERDENYIMTHPRLRYKVNPMLGLVVQHASYDAWVSEAQADTTKRQELLAKYFNVYQTGRVTRWISPDRIRPLQTADPQRRITACPYSEGWNVFVGLDFSSGNDLFALTYLAVNYRHQGPTMEGLMFCDFEAWIQQQTLDESPNRSLYDQWIQQGWLRVCPGEVFNPDLAINALMEKQQAGVNMVAFGYDPAQSKQPINTLKAWLQTLGIDARTIEQMVVPVSQSAMTMNPLISELEQMLLSDPAWLTFSASPLVPWQFGCAAVEVGRTDLRRIVKGGSTASTKIDNIMALLDAVYVFDLSEGRIEANQ